MLGDQGAMAPPLFGSGEAQVWLCNYNRACACVYHVTHVCRFLGSPIVHNGLMAAQSAWSPYFFKVSYTCGRL